MGNARFFTFGIGPSVNRALLQKLASVGRGTCEFLQLTEDIEGAILRFQDRVSFPVMTDLRIECLHGKLWDTYPSILPDVYAGAPLQLVGRVKPGGSRSPRLVIRGLRQGQPVEMTADLVPLPAPEPAVLRAWARARIDDLEEQAESSNLPFHKVRDEIIGLALEHRLVTRFTSFVAIDSALVNPDGKPGLLLVAQPLPEGLDPAGFGPAMPVHYQAMMMSAPSAPPARSMRNFLGEGSHAKRMSVDHSDISHLDIPAFLNRRRAKPSQIQSTPAVSSQPEPEMILRWLARTQNLDGSWPAGAEFTALALLFLVRNGCTTRAGHYRQQVKRAAQWLSATALTGFPSFLAALALGELAGSTGLAEHQSSANALIALLPQPASDLEKAALSLFHAQPVTVQAPTSITDLDELRLARLAGSSIPAPSFLQAGASADLARLWSALPV